MNFRLGEEVSPWSFRFSFTTAHSDETFAGSDRVPNLGGEETTFRQFALSASYRWSDTLQGTVVVPHLSVERKVGGVEVERLLGASDVTALVEWRADEESAWSLIAGLQLPTGEEKKNPAPGVVAPSLLQLGSGTWDPVLGIRWFGSADRWDHWLSAAALLPFGESDAGLEPGPVIRFDYGIGYRVTEDLRLTLGMEDTMRSKDTLAGSLLFNTSSTVANLVPGVAWRFDEAWAVTVRARIPVWVEMDGTQLAPGPLFELALDWMP